MLVSETTTVRQPEFHNMSIRDLNDISICQLLWMILGRGHNTALRCRIVKLYDAAQRIVEISVALTQRTICCATSFLRYDAPAKCCGFDLNFTNILVISIKLRIIFYSKMSEDEKINTNLEKNVRHRKINT